MRDTGYHADLNIPSVQSYNVMQYHEHLIIILIWTTCLKATNLIGHDCSILGCKSVYFKCPGYYCIPWHIVCNAVWDCPWGTDEINCTRTSCPGQFRCHNTSTCIAPDSMCNNIIDCVRGDDEYFCHPELPTCPENCTCINLLVHKACCVV